MIWTPRPLLAVGLAPNFSERHVLIAEIGGRRFKLFQVVLRAGDGSLIVDFPYFSLNQGIVANVPAGDHPGQSTDVQLPDHGQLTSHRVKYSHKLDGESHFSQTGKVYTRMRNRAKSLRQ